MPSKRGAIPPTVERVLNLAAPAKLSPEQTADLAVAVAEALSNAVIHGNRQHPDADVQITVGVTPGRLVRVRVRDAGPGFDHARLNDPTDPARLLLPAGRGIFLMRRLMDRVEYNRPGNAVSLTLQRRR